MKQQAGCTVTVQGVKTTAPPTETIVCPEGITYKEITPEYFEFPIQDITGRIQVTSQTVKVGEAYRLTVSGLAKDNCNSASFQSEDTARTALVQLGNPVWATTLMACVSNGTPAP